MYLDSGHPVRWASHRYRRNVRAQLARSVSLGEAWRFGDVFGVGTRARVTATEKHRRNPERRHRKARHPRMTTLTTTTELPPKTTFAELGVRDEIVRALAEAWARESGDRSALSGRQILQAVRQVQPRTLADSISVGIPRNRVKAWRYVAASGGGFLSVTDVEIVAAIGSLAAAAAF